MADLNALIAQGAQFRIPPPVDPMGNMPQLMQMQSMQQQNQLNQMTMQEKQRGQQEMNALRRLDPSSATYLQDVKQINPKMGFEFEKMQRDAKNADTEGQIKNVKLLTDRLALLPDAYRMADTPEAYLTLHRSIHADPVVGPWLKSTGATLEKGLATIQTAVDTGKFNELRTGSMQSVSQILDSLKPLVVGPSSSVYSGGAFKQAPAAPDKAPLPTDLARLQDELAKLPLGDPRIAQYDAAIRKATTSAPGVTVTVGNEGRYGAQFASKVAEGDVVLRAAAQEAPAAAENANRILRTLATGKAIVGAGADIKLGIAKLLNIAGADNAEIISNTEGMVTSMAQNTLNAIKTSGLGTGQGFTDKDLKFLEAAKSGNINFQPDTIRRLAELSHKAADATATKWNSRAKEIPASAIQGTGVSLEPVRVPKRASSVTAEARPSGVGADWALYVDNETGVKAWVSPDRKQIKEVQQ
jgi:hypothetical protein